MKGLISVIIPNFDDPRIERTLKSIDTQTTNNYEIIIVEGCIDNKNTELIYKTYNSKIKHIIHESDNGIFDALNKGILKSNGSLLFLIGSDDVLSDEHCFSTVLNTLEKNPDSDGVCLGCRFVTSQKKIIRKWKTSKISSTKIKWGILPPHFSLFLKKQLYDEIGLFDFSETNIASDTDWLLRLASKKEVHIPMIKDHFVDMEYGGASTGSIKYIINAIRIIAKSARAYGIRQWCITPFIKLGSKLFQLKIALKTKK